jgi:thiol-disulfide isomerase/thioredoxin
MTQSHASMTSKPLKLSNFRGKLVLLDFWATWCPPCVADTPELKALYESVGKDERFVLIAVSVDEEPTPAIEYAKKNELKWMQAYAGAWGKSQVPGQFGVRGIPAYFLIGPDGKLIDKDLSGNTVRRATEAAVFRPRPRSPLKKSCSAGVLTMRIGVSRVVPATVQERWTVSVICLSPPGIPVAKQAISMMTWLKIKIVCSS